jgi:hypothetical protein
VDPVGPVGPVGPVAPVGPAVAVSVSFAANPATRNVVPGDAWNAMLDASFSPSTSPSNPARGDPGASAIVTVLSAATV